LKRIKAGLLFIKDEAFITESYTRNDVDKLWNSFTSDLARLALSYENDVWQANPTGLCGWCPVKSCEFYKER